MISKYYQLGNTIHTTVSTEIKKKLLEYGKGSLHNGIKNLIDMADKKIIIIRIVTEITLQETNTGD